MDLNSKTVPTPLLEVFFSYSCWALIMKHHRLGGLNNRHLFSHSSGGWKSGCQHGWFLVRAFFLACGRLPSHCALTCGGFGGVGWRRKRVSTPV